jgi:Zn-dependent protease
MGVALVVLFAPRFDDETDTNPYAVTAVFVVALYVSILLHEVAHVVAARSFGMRVPTITLHLLGGETAVEGESRTPWQELVTAIVGPLASLAIGLAARAWADGTDPGVLHDVVWSIAWVNILVAAFNLLPGLPLDGGRVFRAIVWKVTGHEATGIRFAGWLGRLTAVGVVVAVLLFIDRSESAVLDVVLALVVAWFLWEGASHALRTASRTARINGLHARLLLDPAMPAPDDAPHLPVDLQGTALLRAMAARPAEVYVLEEPDGSVAGVLLASRVDTAYRDGA